MWIPTQLHCNKKDPQWSNLNIVNSLSTHPVLLRLEKTKESKLCVLSRGSSSNLNSQNNGYSTPTKMYRINRECYRCLDSRMGVENDKENGKLQKSWFVLIHSKTFLNYQAYLFRISISGLKSRWPFPRFQIEVPEFRITGRTHSFLLSVFFFRNIEK